jgi:hypothetical protein
MSTSPIKIGSITCNKDYAQARLEPAAPGMEVVQKEVKPGATFRLRVKRKEMPSSEPKSLIRIETDDPHQSVLEIPIYC